MDVGEVLAEAGRDSGWRNRGQKGAGPGECKRLKLPSKAGGHCEHLCVCIGLIVRDETAKGLGLYIIDNKEPWQVFK